MTNPFVDRGTAEDGAFLLQSVITEQDCEL
jgi:hypothetical protein